MAEENNRMEVPFTATTGRDSWISFEENGQPEGTTFVSKHVLKGSKSLKGVKINCEPNQGYTSRSEKISFKQETSNKTDEIIVTQSGKACDCEAYTVIFNDNYDTIPYNSGIYTIGEVSGNAVCGIEELVFICSGDLNGDSVNLNGKYIELSVGENGKNERNIVISYKFNGSTCQNTKTIKQDGKGEIVCNCTDLTVRCLENVKNIPYSGTGNEYIAVATWEYTGSCSVSNISVIPQSENPGNVSAKTENGTIFIKVGQNPVKTSRNIYFNFSVSLNSIECSHQNQCSVIQEGETVIPCNCESITAVNWISDTKISSGGTTNRKIVSSIGVIEGCYVSAITAIISEGQSYASVSVNNGEVFLSVQENPSSSTRNVTVQLKYENDICDGLSKTFVQEEKEQPVVECCNYISVTNINQEDIPNTGVTSDDTYVALNYSLNTSEGCSMNKVEIEVSTEKGDEITWTSGNSQVVFTNVQGYYEIGSRTIHVKIKYENNPCQTVSFTQNGCNCDDITLSYQPVPNIKYTYYVVEYAIPLECAKSFGVPSIDIYLEGTQTIYAYYSNKRQDTGRTVGDKVVFGTYANFTEDPFYDYETNTSSGHTLEIRIKFDECSNAFTAPFTRSKADDIGLIMIPLMYRYVKEEIEEGLSDGGITTNGYPFCGATSGTSVVYAPVGYLETTKSGLSVAQVISDDDFVSFDMPLTDYVYNTYSSLTYTGQYTTSDPNDNITPLGDMRAYLSRESLRNRGFDEEEVIRLSNTESEKLISTNQFFFDYGEKTSYNQNNVEDKDEGAGLQLRDYMYEWNFDQIDRDKTYKPCIEDEPCPYCYFYDTLVEESIDSKLDNSKKNRMVILDTNSNKNNVYIIYGQGREYVLKNTNLDTLPPEEHYESPHQYLFQYEWVPITETPPYVYERRIKKHDNKEVAYANNLSVTLRPIYRGKGDTDYWFNPLEMTFGSNSSSIGFRSNEMMDFSYGSPTVNDFRKMNRYIYKNEYNETFPMYYNFEFSKGVSSVTINDHSKTANEKYFKTFPLNIFLHNNEGRFDHRSTNYINIASIDENVTMEIINKEIYFRAQINGAYSNEILSITYYTDTFDDVDEEGIKIAHTYVCTDPTGCGIIPIEKMPLFITIKLISLEAIIDGENVESTAFNTNIFVSKNLSKVKIIAHGNDENLIIDEIRTNITHPNDDWNWD